MPWIKWHNRFSQSPHNKITDDIFLSQTAKDITKFQTQRPSKYRDDPQLDGWTYSLEEGNRPMAYTLKDDDDFLVLYDCT
jgi:hypothetical protein